MSNIKEQIRQEIERQRGLIEGLFIEGDNNFYDGQNDAYNHLLAFINSLLEEKPSEDLLDAAKDALLLERAWLTLDGFGHEELAGRLRQFAERKGLIWK